MAKDGFSETRYLPVRYRTDSEARILEASSDDKYCQHSPFHLATPSHGGFTASVGDRYSQRGRGIKADRGMITIRDRKQLEKLAGGCYGAPEAEFQRVILGHTQSQSV